MIRNRNVKSPVEVADAIDISKIDLEADPNTTLGVTANRYLQVPTLTTAQLVAAGTAGNGVLVYDTTTNSLKASIDGSYVELGAAGTVSLAFKTIDCESGSDPVADTATDTLILTGGSGAITVTGDSSTDTVTFTIGSGTVTATMLAATLDISAKTLTLPTSQTLTTPTIGDFTNANHTHADAANGGAITYVGNVLSTGALTINAAAGANTITIGNLSTGGIIVSDNMTIGAPVFLSGTNDISFYDSALKVWSSTDGQLDIAGDVEVQVATATLDVNASTAALIDTAAFSIDATASSNVSVTGAQLQIATLTSGELDLTSAGLIDINAGANIDVDITGTLDILASTTFSIDGTGASNVTATSGNLTVSTLTTGTLILDSVALLDMNAGANLDVDVTGSVDILATGAMSIDATGASNVSATSGNLTVSTLTTGTLILDSVALLDINAGANLDVDVTGTVDILCDGVLSIDSTGASNISATTGGLTVSTITSGTLTLLSAGIVDIDASGTSDVTINTADDATVDATATGSISLVAGDKGAGTGDGGSINLTAGATTGGSAGVINLNSDVVIASGKDLSATGAGTISTGTGAISLNGDTTVTTGKDFAVVDGTVGLGSGAISTTYTTIVTNLNADKLDGSHLTDITAPSYINMGISGVLGAATSYMHPGIEAADATEDGFFIAPTAGTITKMYTHLGTAPGGADTVIYTVRLGGADQTITCTTSAAETTSNDTAHTVAVTAGQEISVKAVSSAGTAADASVTLEFRGACA